MARQKITALVGVVLALLCVARAGLAQTEATNTTQPSGDQGTPPLRWHKRRQTRSLIAG